MSKLIPILVVLALTACSDGLPTDPRGEIPTAFPDGVNPPGDADTSTPGPLDVPITGKELKLTFKMAVGDDNVSCQTGVNCSIFLSYNATRSLEVVLTGDGAPLAGQLVHYAVENDDAGLGHLSAFSAYTNGSGVASIQVQPNQSVPGSFNVKASVDDATVTPL